MLRAATALALCLASLTLVAAEKDDQSFVPLFNGKQVSGGRQCKPRKGYFCLESEGVEIYFRNLRIKEHPSTHPTADEIAKPAAK